MFKRFWNSLYKLARLPAVFWLRGPCLEDGSPKIIPVGCLVILNPLISSVAVLPSKICVDMWGHNPPHFLHMEKNDPLKCKYEYGVSLQLLLNISLLQINWTGKWLSPQFNHWFVLLPLFLQKMKQCWTAEPVSWRAGFIPMTQHLTPSG